MAIIRCPYCHAIIDENDKYCNNCGTQLLFPEDESVEEEIPGEKIIDVEEDEEEKDYNLGEPAKETTELLDEDRKDETEEERTGELVTGPAEDSGSKDIGVLLEEEPGPEDKEGAEDAAGEDRPAEVILVDEIAVREDASKDAEPGRRDTLPAEPEKPGARPPAPEEETRAYPVRPCEQAEPEDETVELVLPPQPQDESEATTARTSPTEEPGKKPEEKGVRAGEIVKGEGEDTGPAAPAVPATFDTRELEGIGKTVELSKVRLDKMIEVMAEKQEEEAREKAPAPEPEKKAGTLPPWADKIRGGGPDEPEDEEIFPHRKPSDSGIGLPERLTQAALPFEPAAAGEEKGEGAEEEEGLGPAGMPAGTEPLKRTEVRALTSEDTRAAAGFENEAEFEEEMPRPPFHFSAFLKAKAFDVLFIGAFWLVALWVAARSMDATLFELLSVTSAPVLFLYGIFLGLYFFLFKFFLGETLGDRLFKERE